MTIFKRLYTFYFLLKSIKQNVIVPQLINY